MWLVLATLYIVSTGQMVATGRICPDGCTCDRVTMSCITSRFPDELPDNITSVYMNGFNFNSLHRGVFESASWKKLMLLDIQSESGEILFDHSFMGLENLEHLGIHGNENLELIQQSAFEGLDKVRTLDLSDSYFLNFDYIRPSLSTSNRSVLKSMKNLSLAKLYSRILKPMDLDSEFIKHLAEGRSLKYLDISYINVNILDFEAVETFLCNSLEHVKAQKMAIAQPVGYFTAKTCKSLRTLDLTDTIIPITRDNIDFDKTGFDCKYTVFYFNIEHLIISGMNSVRTDIKSYHLNMTDCHFNFRKIVARRIALRLVNITVTTSKSLQESLTELDFSENSIEYLAPEALYPSISLQTLKLSSNDLIHMQTHSASQFSRLLRKAIKLRDVYLDNNKLKNLPETFFETNNDLEYLDLSNNRLTIITFNLIHLHNLKFMKLSFNEFRTLESSTLIKLDNLNKLVVHGNGRNTNITAKVEGLSNLNEDVNESVLFTDEKFFRVNLASNPLECSCSKEQLQFLQWLGTSVTVYRMPPYTCNFEGKALDILTPAVSEVEEFCELQARLKSIRIAIPVTIAVLVLVVLSALCVRRQFMKSQRYKALLKNLKSDKYSKSFLVYLSYCSEDADFVLTKIYENLHSTLSKITNNVKNFVCIGDRNFRPGQHVTSEVARCIEDCAVVIFVVSNTFCKKGWCQSEVNEAYAQRKPIIMLMLEHVDIGVMPRFLNTIFSRYTHAAWLGDEINGHLEPDVHTLCEAILRLASNEENNIVLNCLPFRNAGLSDFSHF